MLLFEEPLKENDFDELMEKLGPQANTYCDIIQPNNVDGQLITKTSHSKNGICPLKTQ